MDSLQGITTTTAQPPITVNSESQPIAQLRRPSSLDEKVFENFKGILTLNPTEIFHRDEYSLVGPERINQILAGIASFNCGQQQLAQLAGTCNARGIKLAFITGERADYGCESVLYRPEHKILYISVPPELPTSNVIAIASLSGTSQDIEFSVIDIGEIIQLQNGSQTLEGYLVGHELSHAMSFIMCTEIGTGNIDKKAEGNRDDYAFLLSQLGIKPNENYISFLGGSLFQDANGADDFRNLFGLGLDDSGKAIISEFHYLNELIGQGEIRTPYNTCALLPLVGCGRLFEFNQLSLIDILYQQGITGDDRETLMVKLGYDPSKDTRALTKRTEFQAKLRTTKLRDDPKAKEVFRSHFMPSYISRLTSYLMSFVMSSSSGSIHLAHEDTEFKAFVRTLIKAVHVYHDRQRPRIGDSMQVLSPQITLTSVPSKAHQMQPTLTIDTFLAEHDLGRRDVRGDGNCGVWAVLQALHTGNEYLSPGATDENIGTQWQPMIELRTAASVRAQEKKAPQATQDRIGTAVTAEALKAQQGPNVLPTGWIATDDFRYFAQLPEVNRPIVVVRDNGIFETYLPNGDAVVARPLEDYKDFFQENRQVLEQYQQPIFVYYNDINHYQAIVHRQA